MKAVGLQPTDTGEVGGKETGQAVSHFIIPNGSYQRACQKLQATGFVLRWQSAPEDRQARARKAASKTKFTCPECGQNAWAKPDALLICGQCFEDAGEAPFMLAESEGEGK